MCSFSLPSPVSSIEAEPQFIEGQLKAGDQGATLLQSRLLDMSLLSLQSPVELIFLRKAPKGRSGGQLPRCTPSTMLVFVPFPPVH
jgi:hypothetical protein